MQKTIVLCAVQGSVRTWAVLASSVAVIGCRPDAYVTMTSPEDGETYVVGDTVQFRAEVNSRQLIEIAHDGDWRWTSDLDGELGYSPLVLRTDLSVGEHLITIRVRNSGGYVLRDQAMIHVEPAGN